MNVSLTKAQKPQRPLRSDPRVFARDDLPNPFAILAIPSRISTTWNLFQPPRLRRLKQRCLQGRLLWKCKVSATDLTSTIPFSTAQPARKPISNRIPSNMAGMVGGVGRRPPRFSRSPAIRASYALSNRPGASLRRIRTAASTISSEMAFSVISIRCGSLAKMHSWRSAELGALHAFAGDSFPSAAS